MKKLLTVLVAVFAFSFAANAADYSLNESAIDAVIENAVEVNAAVDAEFPAALPATPAIPAVSQKSDGAAFVLTIFLGWCGIHRMYMGSTPVMWLWYLLLNFVFVGEVIVTVDFIVELIALIDGRGFSKYYNNKKLLMWA